MSRALILSLVTALSLVACRKDEVETGDTCEDLEDAASAEETTTDEGTECESAPACMSLPEAVDRGLVSFDYDGSRLNLANADEGQAVCVDGWFLLITEDSQDNGFGEPGDEDDDGSSDEGDDDTSTEEGEDDGGCDEEAETKHERATKGGRTRLAPSEIKPFTYAGGGQALDPDLRTWWCVEETQVTTAASDFQFDGAHVPGPLLDFAVHETDLDGDGVEDHQDPSGSAYQTNTNIWTYQRDNPVMAVGRATNTFDLQPGESSVVTVQVRNIGGVAGRATVTEILPPSTHASDFSLEPVAIDTDARGREVVTWEIDLAARETTGTNEHTAYARMDLSYRLTVDEGAACPLRREGVEVEAAWTDAGEQRQLSYGAPLLVDCCRQVE